MNDFYGTFFKLVKVDTKFGTIRRNKSGPGPIPYGLHGAKHATNQAQRGDKPMDATPYRETKPLPCVDGKGTAYRSSFGGGNLQNELCGSIRENNCLRAQPLNRHRRNDMTTFHKHTVEARGSLNAIFAPNATHRAQHHAWQKPR